MTSKLKCPVCDSELSLVIAMYSCEKCGLYCNQKAKDALIQAKQDLGQYERKDNLQQQLNANNNQIQENYKQIVEIDEQIIENLEKDLEIATKALKEIAYGTLPYPEVMARETLEQMTHDNNKD